MAKLIMEWRGKRVEVHEDVLTEDPNRIAELAFITLIDEVYREMYPNLPGLATPITLTEAKVQEIIKERPNAVENV